jgi:thiamine transport system substrate-binding protein
MTNNALVVNDWSTAYYTNFSLSGGDRPIVVSYGSSPPFEVIESQSPDYIPQSAVMTSDGSCFRQIEFVGVLRGAKNPDLARKWIDFMLSTTFQEDMPLQMYVFPVNSKARLDETFQKFLSIPENPAYVSPDEIAANREAWINAWTEAVLR